MTPPDDSASRRRPPRPRGRRPGPTSTRDDVLAAARAVFADHGYDGATIRAIAARADVDPALIIQFFASKDGLFAAAMELPFDAAAAVDTILSGPRSRTGERIVSTFLRLWDDPEIGPQMLGLVRSASTHAAAAARLRELIDHRLLSPIAESLAADDAHLRAQLVGAHLVGLGFARYVVQLRPLTSAPAEELVRYIGPAVQRYLTGT